MVLAGYGDVLNTTPLYEEGGEERNTITVIPNGLQKEEDYWESMLLSRELKKQLNQHTSMDTEDSEEDLKHKEGGQEIGTKRKRDTSEETDPVESNEDLESPEFEDQVVEDEVVPEGTSTIPAAATQPSQEVVKEKPKQPNQKRKKTI